MTGRLPKNLVYDADDYHIDFSRRYPKLVRTGLARADQMENAEE
jgi:hypothetical protein